MKKVGIKLLLLMTAVITILTACGKDSEEDSSKKVKIGSSATALKIVESGVSELEKMGYDVEIVTFDDYLTPNRALDEGEVDCNIYQHKPFMDNFNNSNGTNLVMLEPRLWNYYTGFYSKKHKSIDELPQNAVVGIANNASNISLHMEYLRDWGLIELNEEPVEGEFYSELDISENPKNISFISASGAQRFSSAGEYDAYFGTSNEMYTMGIDLEENQIEKKTDDRWTIGITVNEKDKDSQLAKDLMTAYTSESAREYVNKEMKGAYVLSEALSKELK